MARNLAKLGEYQLRARQLEQARTSLNEAEHLAETTEEKMHLAEITRLLGLVWQAEGHPERAGYISSAPSPGHASRRRASSN